MDSDLMIIFPFVIVAALIVFGFVLKVLQFDQRKLELKARIAEAEAGGNTRAPDNNLEERVRVLERLATDRPGITSASLADEIESLRAESPALNDHRTESRNPGEQKLERQD